MVWDAGLVHQARVRLGDPRADADGIARDCSSVGRRSGMKIKGEFSIWMPFAAILYWYLVTAAIVVLSGWKNLEPRYKCKEKSSGYGFFMASAKIGTPPLFLNYGACLTVFVAQNGFYIQPNFIARFFTPKLFIPWEDVQSVTSASYYFIPGQRIRLSNSILSFKFYGSLGKAMLEAWTASRSRLET